jgi:thioesterase domain-containing protein
MHLQDFLYEQIPLSRHLGVKIQHIDDLGAKVWAPLEPNRNHMGTAFGGSLQAVLVLSAYAWLFALMESRGHICHVILQESTFEFLKPVEGDFVAECKAPAKKNVEKFLTGFKRKNKARILIRASVEKSCLFSGKFVVQKSSQPHLS